MEHPSVKQATVITREDRPGDVRLTAYVVPEHDGDFTSTELRDFLRETLPDYMIPSFFVELDALPLTKTGKVDRRALPAPGARREEDDVFVSPRDDRERPRGRALGPEPEGPACECARQLLRPRRPFAPLPRSDRRVGAPLGCTPQSARHALRNSRGGGEPVARRDRWPMKPFFFGRSPRRLFGVHEAPSEQASRDEAVVLCYSAPQEYMQAHWTFRRLARQLSDSGFHVLRFDYFGTGDSAGESDEGTLAQWCQDIRAAAHEILDLSGARHLSAVGFRLGAAMTTMVDLRLRSLVLWEPVVHGRGLHRRSSGPYTTSSSSTASTLRACPLAALCWRWPAIRFLPPYSRASRPSNWHLRSPVEPSGSGSSPRRDAPTCQALVERLGAEVPHVSSDLARPEEAGGSPFLQSTRAPQRIVEFLASAAP